VRETHLRESFPSYTNPVSDSHEISPHVLSIVTPCYASEAYDRTPQRPVLHGLPTLQLLLLNVDPMRRHPEEPLTHLVGRPPISCY
jgi:hypothetical protein